MQSKAIAGCTPSGLKFFSRMVETIKQLDIAKWLGTMLLGILLWVYLEDRSATKEWRGELREWRHEIDKRMHEMDKRISIQEKSASDTTNKQLQALLDHFRAIGASKNQQPNRP